MSEHQVQLVEIQENEHQVHMNVQNDTNEQEVEHQVQIESNDEHQVQQNVNIEQHVQYETLNNYMHEQVVLENDTNEQIVQNEMLSQTESTSVKKTHMKNDHLDQKRHVGQANATYIVEYCERQNTELRNETIDMCNALKDDMNDMYDTLKHEMNEMHKHTTSMIQSVHEDQTKMFDILNTRMTKERELNNTMITKMNENMHMMINEMKDALKSLSESNEKQQSKHDSEMKNAFEKIEEVTEMIKEIKHPSVYSYERNNANKNNANTRCNDDIARQASVENTNATQNAWQNPSFENLISRAHFRKNQSMCNLPVYETSNFERASRMPNEENSNENFDRQTLNATRIRQSESSNVRSERSHCTLGYNNEMSMENMYRPRSNLPNVRQSRTEQYVNHSNGQNTNQNDHKMVRVRNFNSNENDWISYRNHFLGIANKANWNDSTKCVKLLAALDSTHFEVTEGLPYEYTFSDLLGKLDHMYGVEFASRKARNDLKIAKRKDGESIPMYGERVRNLVTRAYVGYRPDQIDELALQVFLDGIPNKQNFRVQMKAIPFKTLYEAIGYGANLDQILEKERQNYFNRKTEICDEDLDCSDNEGSFSDDDFENIRKTVDECNKTVKKIFHNSKMKHNKFSKFPKKENDKTNETRPRPTACFLCDDPNHFMTDCPLKDELRSFINNRKSRGNDTKTTESKNE